MRKIFLSLVALCCIVTTAFAAVGDKVYFVNNAAWEGDIYAHEYGPDWANLEVYGKLESCGWQYNNKDVYVYTVQNEGSVILAIEVDGWTKKSSIENFVVGCYYLIGDVDGTNSWEDSGATAYWSSAYYYNEFYFLDNNGSDYEFGAAPYIALYNSESTPWVINGSGWPGELMTSIGQFKKYDGEGVLQTYNAYKYVTLTPASYGACAEVIFNNNNGISVPSPAIDASKRFFAWWNWYTLPEVAGCIQLVGEAAITGTGWGDNAENVMWYYEGVYSVTRNNVHITAENYYSFRVYPGFGENNWNARFPHANAADWHESIHLTPGLYSLYFVYNPATDELTCTPTACYSREVGAADKWGTMCLPNASTSYSGATFYTIAKKGGNAIVLQEVEGQLKAGYPYFFKSSDAWVSVNLDTTAYANMPGHSNGLYGSYWEYALTDHENYDYYMLFDNELYEVEGDEAKVGAYRCFVNMDEVPIVADLAPGKRYVHMTVNGENGTTAIEDIQSDKVQSIKVIENGQFFIIKNGEKYNAQGIIVK